jgi:hypothetical protein
MGFSRAIKEAGNRGALIVLLLPVSDAGGVDAIRDA